MIIALRWSAQSFGSDGVGHSNSEGYNSNELDVYSPKPEAAVHRMYTLNTPRCASTNATHEPSNSTTPLTSTSFPSTSYTRLRNILQVSGSSPSTWKVPMPCSECRGSVSLKLDIERPLTSFAALLSTLANRLPTVVLVSTQTYL